MAPRRASLPMDPTLPAKDLRVRTPKVREDYDRAIDEYAEEQNPRSIKNKAKKAQRAAEEAMATGSKMEQCSAIVKLLTLRDDSYWFQDPVPVDDVPDYLEIVPEPMDYTTIRHKILTGEYLDDHIAFAADMRKVFTNAVKYNWSPDHPCNVAARAGLRDFEALFARVTGATPGPGSAPPQHALPQRKRHRASQGAGASSGGRGGADDSGGKKARMRGSAGEAGASGRDQQLIASLAEYLESCGGEAGMVDGWYTRTEVRKGGGTAGTFDTYFFSPAGKRFRSRAEIARFFELEAAPAKTAKSLDVEERKAQKSAEKEHKRVQREAVAAVRNAEMEAERALRNRYPVPDERLGEEEPPEPPLGVRPAPLPPYVEGVPPSRMADVLQVCDFLRALSSNLQLPTYTPSELSAALQPTEAEPNPKLADLQQALLQLVLTDKNISAWWGEPPPEPERPKPPAKAAEPKPSGKPKWWEPEAKPPFKCDLNAVLATTEPASKTRRWVSQLETIAPMRTNTGVPIRQAVVTARAISTDPEVRRYLDRALAAWRGNAAGTTKFGALWLASQVRRKRPQIWASAEMEGDGAAGAGEGGEGASQGGEGASQAGEGVSQAGEGAAGGEEDRAGSEMAVSEREGEEEGEEEEGEGGEEEGGEEEGEAVEGAEEIDKKLWLGAADEGWRVHGNGQSGQTSGHWVYSGPSGSKYLSQSAAAAARDDESKRAAEATSAVLGLPLSASGPPEALVGMRVSVLWEGDDAKRKAADNWFTGQLWAYDGSTNEYHILYDDNSEERLDLTKTKYKVVYNLQPPHLALAHRPAVPDVSDVTAYSWPPLLAAVVLRLVKHWDPACPIDDPPFEGRGANGEGAMPPKVPAGGTPMDASTANGAEPHVPGEGHDLASPRSRLKREPFFDGRLPTAPSAASPLATLAPSAPLAPAPPAPGPALAALQQALSALLSAAPSSAHEVYAQLSPTQKLMLLTALVDGACDSPHTGRAVDTLMATRRELLEKEEEADKEKRRLARAMRDEARALLREQIAAQRNEGEEGDEDTPTEPTELQVSLEVQRRLESQACGGSVFVLTRDALHSAEAELAIELELQAANGINAEGNDFSEEELQGIVARRDLLKLRRDTYGPRRDAATAQLRQAASSSSAEQMEAALRAAAGAALEGDADEDGIGPGGRWLTSDMRDVYIALSELNTVREEQLASGQRQVELSQLVARSEPLGRDRYGRRYWWLVPLEGPTAEPHVWCEPRTAEVVGGLRDAPLEEYAAGEGGGGPCGRDDWQRFVGEGACAAIAASLDERGVAERGLKHAIERGLHDLRNRRVAEAADRAAQGA